MRRLGLPIVICLSLAACEATTTSSGGGDFLREVPPEVVALAAPGQDLSSVRYMPEDGCYWYRHQGPVEATMLPLRTSSGRPICAPKTAEAAAS